MDFVIAGDLGWATTEKRGHIKNVLADQVKVLSGKFCGSRICGFDETHKVEDVTISNLEILGRKIKDAKDGKFEIDEKTTAEIHFA